MDDKTQYQNKNSQGIPQQNDRLQILFLTLFSFIVHISLYFVLIQHTYFLAVNPIQPTISIKLSSHSPLKQAEHKFHKAKSEMTAYTNQDKEGLYKKPTPPSQTLPNGQSIPPKILKTKNATFQKDDHGVLKLFSQIRLPESLLGQNLFPRKYQATFTLKSKENSQTFFQCQSLIPISHPLPYVDSQVFQYFIENFLTLDEQDVKNALLNLEKQKRNNNISAQDKESIGLEVKINIEFNEKTE